MMDNLLKNDFNTHYGLHAPSGDIVRKETSALYFELADDENLIYLKSDEGCAKYNNTGEFSIEVINYETFIKSLPPDFQQNRENCDLIVFSDKSKYFLLNELTNTNSKYVDSYINNKGNQPGKRAKAIQQLSSSLSDLVSVETIKSFVDSFIDKRCCFFNKQPNTPLSLIAVSAFNRLNEISKDGYKMTNESIESLGFSLYEYSGTQSLSLN